MVDVLATAFLKLQSTFKRKYLNMVLRLIVLKNILPIQVKITNIIFLIFVFQRVCLCYYQMFFIHEVLRPDFT